MRRIKMIFLVVAVAGVFLCNPAQAQVSVEEAISWAEGQIGNDYDNSCKRVWHNWCMHFCGHAYRHAPTMIDNAMAGWTSAAVMGERYATNDSISIPRGALVFFDIGPDGHVGLSLGDGIMIHAWTDGVRKENINKYPNLLGWRWPEGWTNDSPSRTCDYWSLPYRQVANVAWYPPHKSCVNAQRWRYFDECGGGYSIGNNSICYTEADKMQAALGYLSDWWNIIYGEADLTGTCSQY